MGMREKVELVFLVGFALFLGFKLARVALGYETLPPLPRR
jgi:hypothetical protein